MENRDVSKWRKKEENRGENKEMRKEVNKWKYQEELE